MSNSKKIIRPFVLTKDPLVQRILERFAKRSENGIKKYGRTMVDATKSIDEWIDDAQEESWDKIVYLEKIKIELQKKEGGKYAKKEKEK
mgnify:FL=1|tara:strand:+ start:599 stop:865 length:267 start_codon:yes stop_codon:yes gene_type:complete